MTKYLTDSDLREEGPVLACSFKRYSLSWQGKHDRWSHCIHENEAERVDCWCLPGFLFFLLLFSQIHQFLGWYRQDSGSVFSLQLNLSGTNSQTGPEARCLACSKSNRLTMKTESLLPVIGFSQRLSGEYPRLFVFRIQGHEDSVPHRRTSLSWCIVTGYKMKQSILWKGKLEHVTFCSHQQRFPVFISKIKSPYPSPHDFHKLDSSPMPVSDHCQCHSRQPGFVVNTGTLQKTYTWRPVFLRCFQLEYTSS